VTWELIHSEALFCAFVGVLAWLLETFMRECL
jgi:hypothetical protein